MNRSRRRLLALLLSLPFLVVATACLYMLGMAFLEGEPRGFWRSVEWAGETLTTTGYGADATWRHPAMVLFVVAVQFIGVFLVFLVVPIYLIPFLEERFEVRLPQDLPSKVSGHVLVYRYGPAVATLLQELAAAKVPAVVLEEDEASARRLFEAGEWVVARPLDEGGLAAAGLDRARALIANGTDDQNAALILTARQLGYAGQILALVEDPSHRRPIMLAGASAAYTPRHILAAALAARASSRINPRVAGLQQLGRRLQVAEVRIETGSPLAGRTLEEAAIGAATGATVIGQWVAGELVVPPTAGMRLVPDGILIVVGSEESIGRLDDLARGTVSLRRGGPFIVGGYGEVGQKVTELLRDAGEEVRVVERREAPGVDVVGNMLDLAVLQQAGIGNAQAVILALDADSATLFATVILKDLAPEVPVIARVNEAEDVERIHRAGAFYALSIAQVSGQMLARRLLGQEAVAIDPQLKVLKVPAGALAGRRPAELAIRQRTGCSVVAVERGEEVFVELGPDFGFEAEDAVYVCGSPQALQRFAEVFLSG